MQGVSFVSHHQLVVRWCHEDELLLSQLRFGPMVIPVVRHISGMLWFISWTTILHVWWRTTESELWDATAQSNKVLATTLSRIMELKNTGWRVDFTSSDSSKGRQSGCRCCLRTFGGLNSLVRWSSNVSWSRHDYRRTIWYRTPIKSNKASMWTSSTSASCHQHIQTRKFRETCSKVSYYQTPQGWIAMFVNNNHRLSSSSEKGTYRAHTEDHLKHFWCKLSCGLSTVPEKLATQARHWSSVPTPSDAPLLVRAFL